MRSESSADRPRYRRISTRMWGDEKFRQLSRPRPNGQSLWQFLLTGPQTRNVPGLFAIGEAGLAEMLNWPLPGFRKAWRELERLGMVQADWRARLVWIPNAIRHNPPESPNVVRSWRATLDDMPECRLKTDAVAALVAECQAFGQAFAKAFAEVLPGSNEKALANQEQDQEQDQEQETFPLPNVPERLQSKPSEAELLQSFERFWLRYPRHEQREPARMIWFEIGPSAAGTEQITTSLEAHRLTKAWQDAIASRDLTFVPLAKTWLRERRWLDVPAPGVPTAAATTCKHRHDPPCPTGDEAACTARYLAELRGDRTSVEAVPA